MNHETTEERELTESLALFHEQLKDLDTLLPSLELDTLRLDLQHLVQLTEQQLLAVVKARLLGTPAPVQLELKAAHVFDTAPEIATDESPSLSKPGLSYHLQEGDALCVGAMCVATYLDEWGGRARGVARVHGVDSDRQLCTVLLAHPRTGRMRVCDRFQQGTCRLPSAQCRFSHGLEVALLALHPCPPMPVLAAGCECLFKTADGTWADAVVVEIIDAHFCIVERADYSAELLAVPSQDVSTWTANIIAAAVDDNDEEEDDDADCHDNEMADVDGRSRLDAVEHSTSPMATQLLSGPLGSWESHTKGVGSTLMARMGYVAGQGLGLRSDGRREPVQVRILPPGKSLDACMHFRLSGEGREPGGSRKSKRRAQQRGVEDAARLMTVKPRNPDPFRDTGLQIISTEAQFSTLQRELAAVSAAETRNAGSNSVAAQLADARVYLTSQLSAQQSALDRLGDQVRKTNERRKMTVF